MAKTNLLYFVLQKIADGLNSSYKALMAIRTPKLLSIITNVLWKGIKKAYPEIAKYLDVIIEIAFKISKAVNEDGTEGYIKKGKVVKGMQELANALGITIPEGLLNLINEVVYFVVKYDF